MQFLKGEKTKEKIINKLADLFAVDLRALACYRIGTALLLIISYTVRFPDIVAHYSDFGVLPRFAMIEWYTQHKDFPWYWSFHLINGSPIFQCFLFILGYIFAVGLLIGYRTRLMTFLCWALYYSLDTRNPFVGYPGDHIVWLQLFWGMFLPLGACFSVDNTLNRHDCLKPKYVLSVASTLILLQVVFVYFFTGIAKSGPEWVSEGSAIFYSLHRERFAKPFAAFLLNYRGLLKHLTFFVHDLEIYGSLLLFSPIWTKQIRLMFCFMLIFMQLGFHLSLSLGMFPLISFFAMLPFVPTWFWDKLESWIVGSNVEKLIKRLREFFLKICQRIPEKWNYLVSSKPISYRTKRRTNIFMLVCLVYVLLSLFSSHKLYGYKMPENWKWFGQITGISQGWHMFAPAPSHRGGWYVIPGKLVDGSSVDLFRDGSEVNWRLPKEINKMYSSMRWRMFMTRLRIKVGGFNLKPYSRWVCYDWNRRHSGSEKLQSFVINFMRRTVHIDGRITGPKKIEVFRHRCGQKKKRISIDRRNLR